MKQQFEHAVPAAIGERVVSYTIAKALGLEWRDLRSADVRALVRIDMHDVWIRQDLGEWRAMLRIVPSKNGNPVIAEVRLFPLEPDAVRQRAPFELGEWSGCYVGARAVVPGSGLTARILKSVKLGQARTAGIGMVREKYCPGGPIEGFWPRRPAGQPKRGGRRRIPDETVVKLAAVYARDFENPNPVELAAKTCHITRTQARDWLHLARKRGILCPADTTRPHGELTPKGMEMLNAIKARAATKPPVQTKGGRRR